MKERRGGGEGERKGKKEGEGERWDGERRVEGIEREREQQQHFCTFYTVVEIP